MNAAEFAAWRDVLTMCPLDEDGSMGGEGELVWEAMQHAVAAMAPPEPRNDWSLGEGVAWAAFWLTLGAVLVTLTRVTS